MSALLYQVHPSYVFFADRAPGLFCSLLFNYCSLVPSSLLVSPVCYLLPLTTYTVS